MKKEAQLFKVLADETRLRILALLIEGELCVCEIIAALELPQSTISRHLGYLRKNGWVSDRRQGVWMYYKLKDDESRLVGELIPILKNQLVDSSENLVALERLERFRKEQNQQAC